MNMRASFSNMKDSTRADWQLIGQEFVPYSKALPDCIMARLRIFEDDYGGYGGHALDDYRAEFRDLYDAPAVDKHARTLPFSEFEPRRSIYSPAKPAEQSA